MTTVASPQLAAPYALRRDSMLEPLVYDGVCPELAPRLIEVVLAHSRRERSIGSLNVGGWKSPETFFGWPEPEVAQLARALIGIVGGRPIGWAMVNRPGAYHKRHQHGTAIVTGIYYLDDSATPTVFEVPARARKGERVERLEIEPAVGRLALFPGEMWHEVPVVTDQQRITIAFDVRRLLSKSARIAPRTISRS